MSSFFFGRTNSVFCKKCNMKRLLGLLIFGALALPVTSAAVGSTTSASLFAPALRQARSHHLRDFRNNTYVAFGAGPNLYFHNSGADMGVGAELTYGKWLLTTAGLRLYVAGYYSLGGSQMYAYGGLDYFFDPITAIRGRNTSNILRTYLIMGSGLTHSGTGDNDFYANFGLGADWKVADDWRLFAELKCRVHPSDFDNNAKSSLMTSAMVGAVRDIAFNPNRSRAVNETRQMENDWFFQVAGGVNSLNHKGLSSSRERLSLLTATFEFGIGKRLSTLWAVRVYFSGLYTHSSEELFSFYNARGDIMLDLASLLGYDLPVPRFSVQPYVGAGVVTRLDDQSHFLIAIAGGGQILFRPSVRNTVFLDARYVVTPPRFVKVATPQTPFSVGVATLSIGYSYTFAKSSFR